MEKIVAGNCCGSPINTQCELPSCNEGRMDGSEHCAASSMTTTENSETLSSTFDPADPKVVITM